MLNLLNLLLMSKKQVNKDEAQGASSTPPVKIPERRYRVQWDLDYHGLAHEPKPGTMTIPDMSLTVRQLLDANVRNISTGAIERQQFHFDVEVPVIRDITDLAEYKASLERRAAEIDEIIAREAEAAELLKQVKEDEPKTKSNGDLQSS
jgi:hypothetical protein